MIPRRCRASKSKARTIPAIPESAGFPFCGSGVFSSSIGSAKVVSIRAAGKNAPRPDANETPAISRRALARRLLRTDIGDLLFSVSSLILMNETLPGARRLTSAAATASETTVGLKISHDRRSRGEWALLLVLATIQFTIAVDFVIMLPLGPQLMRAFNINTAQFNLAVAAYAFAASFSGLAAGFFLDRFGRKRALRTRRLPIGSLPMLMTT